MKSIIYFVVVTLLLIGCETRQSSLDRWMDQVEKAIEIDPDSAQIILDSISSPEKMNDELFARWCMLSGKITDKVYNTLLLAEYFDKAFKWYSNYGKPTEQVQILIYLGALMQRMGIMIKRCQSIPMLWI